MTKDLLISLKEKLSEYNENEVNTFLNYIKDNSKESYIKWKDATYLANKFRIVKTQWLKFDWKHITLNSHWISYDYVAYKNKLLLNYPESIIDVNLVYKDDTFEFQKENGKIIYNHKFWNPFKRKTEDIIWAYAVIKNKRWEFLTLLDKEELDKHKKTAKMQDIWNSWYAEMSLKTIIKKACKQHFGDDFDSVEEEDNNQYDLTKTNTSDILDIAKDFNTIEK